MRGILRTSCLLCRMAPVILPRKVPSHQFGGSNEDDLVGGSEGNTICQKRASEAGIRCVHVPDWLGGGFQQYYLQLYIYIFFFVFPSHLYRFETTPEFCCKSPPCFLFLGDHGALFFPQVGPFTQRHSVISY